MGNNHNKNVLLESKNISYLIDLKGYSYVDANNKIINFLKKLFLVNLYLNDTYRKN